MKRIELGKLLVTGLAIGCVLHPASSAVALCLILLSQLAEKYFTRNVSDQDRKDIYSLKTDVEKLNILSQKEGLSKAFGNR